MVFSEDSDEFFSPPKKKKRGKRGRGCAACSNARKVELETNEIFSFVARQKEKTLLMAERKRQLRELEARRMQRERLARLKRRKAAAEAKRRKNLSIARKRKRTIEAKKRKARQAAKKDKEQEVAVVEGQDGADADMDLKVDCQVRESFHGPQGASRKTALIDTSVRESIKTGGSIAGAVVPADAAQPQTTVVNIPIVINDKVQKALAAKRGKGTYYVGSGEKRKRRKHYHRHPSGKKHTCRGAMQATVSPEETETAGPTDATQGTTDETVGPTETDRTSEPTDGPTEKQATELTGGETYPNGGTATSANGRSPEETESANAREEKTAATGSGLAPTVATVVADSPGVPPGISGKKSKSASKKKSSKKKSDKKAPPPPVSATMIGSETDVQTVTTVQPMSQGSTAAKVRRVLSEEMKKYEARGGGQTKKPGNTTVVQGGPQGPGTTVIATTVDNKMAPEANKPEARCVHHVHHRRHHKRHREDEGWFKNYCSIS